MSDRGLLWISSVLLLLAVAVLQVAAKPPHIIFIVADDLGKSISSFVYTVL